MRTAAIGLPLGSGAIASYAQIANFSHIVVIVQETRTPDNLFQGLCTAPFGSPSSCVKSPTIAEKKYNIQTSDWQNKSRTIQPKSVPLADNYDLGHTHSDFEAMCDESAGVCKMGGVAGITCGPAANCPKNPQFRFVDNSTGILNPYLATEYGWANYMFQTNQGPSFSAHPFLFGAMISAAFCEFIEQNFGVKEGELGFADARSTTGLTRYFYLNAKPSVFKEIKAQRNAEFFLNDTRPPTNPDTD